MLNYLTYNGTKSTDLGVYVTGSGSFDAAEMDSDKYEIAGRNGDLIIPKNRYKNIVVNYPAFIPKAFQNKAQSIRNWMRSAKAYARLEDTYDMEHFRLGLASGIQSFEPVNRNDASNFQLSFDCRPERFLKTGETPLTVVPEAHTYSGEIVSFETVAVDDLTKAEVSLSPIQSGSGDPSPTNVRPITGHDSATLYRTGKNLWSFNASYQSASSGTLISRQPFAIKPATYTLSMKGSVGNAMAFTFRDANNTVIVTKTIYASSFVNGYMSTQITLDRMSADLNVYSAAAYNISEIQLELGSSATAYEPYNGDSFTISLGQTVYGGTLDVVTGQGEITWENIASYSGESLPGEWISDRDVYAEGTTPTIGAQVVYELATPIQLSLSPQEIDTLLGQNVVWGNGKIEIAFSEPFSLTNPTQFEARPLLRVVNPEEDDVIDINGTTITFTDDFTGEMFIDCETMDAFAEGVNANSFITATDFPVLNSGLNIVRWSGSGELYITPRWWEL